MEKVMLFQAVYPLLPLVIVGDAESPAIQTHLCTSHQNVSGFFPGNSISELSDTLRVFQRALPSQTVTCSKSS